MIEKIIIENRSDAPFGRCMGHVRSVIAGGRISDNGKQYCYLTDFGDGLKVAASLNKKSDKFVVTGKLLK